MSEKKIDDLDAVRTITNTLAQFDSDTQSRIVRWACEKLGLSVPSDTAAASTSNASVEVTPSGPSESTQAVPHHKRGGTDIKSFISEKNPASNNEFSACVAYYYRFEAPDAQQKDAINGEDLLEACRLAGRARVARPSQTLVNAYAVGLLTKTDDRGHYAISTVGENLVAMTLPSGNSGKRAMSAGGKKGQKAATKKKASTK